MPSFIEPSPVHRVVAYYQTQTDGNNKFISPTPLISLATHLIVAAFHINDDKTVTLNNNAPDSSCYNQLWIDVARMQGSGVKVMAMLGGASDGSFQHLTDNFNDYYPPLKSCLQNYRLDGIDLDVETSKEKIDDIVKLVQQLRADFGKDFIITLTPVASAMINGASSSNISGFSYSTLETDCGDDIDWYNVQFYSNMGSMKNTTDYTKIVTGFPLDPSRLVAITLTNNGTGWVELDTVKATVRQLLQMYGHSFGGVAGWEYYNSQPDTAEPWSWAALMKVAMVNWKEVLAAG
jgi:hypothetical protein